MAADFPCPAGSPVQNVFDAIIVGGGIMGAALFHRLARSGRQVLLVEKSRLTQGATGWSSGILTCFHASEKLTALACASFPEFLDLARQGGPEIRRCGALHFVKLGQETATCERIREMRGVAPMEWLNAGQGAEQWPDIRWDDLAGAVLEPNAGYVDAAAVTRFWIDKGRAMGQTVLEGVEFRGVAQHAGGVVGIHSSMGLLRGRCVVLCTGAWTRKLAATSGLPLPANIFSRSLQCEAFATAQSVEGHPAFLDLGTGIYGRADGPGMMRIGMAMADWNIDPDAHAPHSQQQQNTLRNLAARRFRWSAQAQPAGGWRRFDAFTADGDSVVAADARISRLYWATGFSGHGVKVAPGVAAQLEKLAFSEAAAD